MLLVAAVRERLEQLAAAEQSLLDINWVRAINDEDIRKYFGPKRVSQDAASFEKLFSYLTEQNAVIRIRRTNDVVDGVLWMTADQITKYLHVGRAVLYDVTHNTNKFVHIILPFFEIPHEFSVSSCICTFLLSETTTIVSSLLDRP